MLFRVGSRYGQGMHVHDLDAPGEHCDPESESAEGCYGSVEYCAHRFFSCVPF